jgi:hypothetical protein
VARASRAPALDGVLDRAARMRTEAAFRTETAAPSVRPGYAAAADRLASMLSLVGQRGRPVAPGGAGPADRAEAQRDVNLLWGEASRAPSPVRRQRLRRAATLYANAAGRFFAAESREGRRLSRWASGQTAGQITDGRGAATAAPGSSGAHRPTGTLLPLLPLTAPLTSAADGPRLYTPGRRAGSGGASSASGPRASSEAAQDADDRDRRDRYRGRDERMRTK